MENERKTVLEVTNVTKRFGGLEALSDLSVSVYDGEILGLIGPNGSGKTTLFNCITGVAPITSGRIILDGVDITGLKSWEIARKGVSRSYQIAQTFGNMSVIRNVMTGVFINKMDYSNAENTAMEQLVLFGLSDKSETLASRLNLGERKKLEIAKSLATQPKLLLLDEVMAGLTMSEAMEIAEIIKNINQSCITIIMIEHNMEMIKSVCERLIVLNFGKRIMEGSPQEAATNEEVIEAYLGATQ